eukprot:COSAG06_NODE_824_length_12073_cov_102.305161_16_plen_87_part_00
MGRHGGELAKRGGRIIQWCLEKLLLDHRAWSPVQEYWWPNEMKETGPFSCRENIMWTGAKSRHYTQFSPEKYRLPRPARDKRKENS